MLKKMIFTAVSINFFILGSAFSESYDPPYQHEKVHRFVSVDERGRYTETVERISRVMNEYGADRYGRHSFDQKTTQESLKILHAENRLPSGKILKLEKDWIKSSDGGRKDGRNFDDVKTTTIVFPEVVVGSLLYSKHVLRHFKPEKSGEFQLKYALSPHIVFKEVITTVRLPKSLNVLVNNNGFTGGILHQDKKYITYRYAIEQSTAYKREDSSADNEDYSPYLIFTQARDYIDIGRNYYRASAPKVRITPEIKRLAFELTDQVKSDEAKVKALYVWVAKNIRYVSTTVDDGGLVPRDSNYILSRRFGDCKDHVVLLEALLRAVGIESTAALVNLGEAFEFHAGPAANSPINHVITYIPSLDLYLDSTAQFVPFGRLDDQVVDKPTVLVALNRLGRTPKMHAAENTLRSYTTMTLQTDGSVVGKNESALSGTMEINSRLARFSEQMEPMEKTVNDLLFRFNEIGSGHISYTPPKNIDAAFTWRSNFTLDAITDLSRSGAFTIPVGVAPGYLPATTIYKPLEKRLFPYICDSVTTEDRYSITLPGHIAIESMPVNVDYKSTNSHYESTYTLNGTQLEVERKLIFQFPSRKCSPDMYPELLEVIRIIRADHRSPVVFSIKQ